MSSSTVCLVLYYGGELSVSDDFFPTYTGGENRPILISRRANFNNVQDRIMRSLNIDSTRFRINLVCRFPVGSSFIATTLADDEVCESVINAATAHPVVVYVESELLQIIDTEAHDYAVDEFQAIETSEHHLQPRGPHHSCEDVDIPAPPIRATDIASTSVNMDEYHSDEVAPPETGDEGYETMPSVTSSDTDDSEGEIGEENYPNAATSQILREYSNKTAPCEEHMFTNNEYVQACQSTQQWDEELNFDGLQSNSIFLEDNFIPADLLEGMCFHDKGHLKFTVQGWSIINSVEYVTCDSNKSRFTVRCIHSNNPNRPCLWRLHARASKRLGGAWVISTLSGPHTCSHSVLSTGHRQCTSQFISYYIQPVIRCQLDLKPREIIGRIESKFEIRVSYMKAWDARRKAIQSIFGSWEESYRSLDQFMVVLCSVIPGTVYRIQSSIQGQFQRIFWAFGPSIAGWQFCRPVLSLDGTFLLGKYRGTLLTAVGIDANNGLFPLAFAIVEAECNDSWNWFIMTLRDLVPIICSRPDLCIISDRHSGLVRACREILQWAKHRHCLRHLRENFKKTCRTMGISDTEFMCQKMYVAGNTMDIHIYTRYMTDIKNIKPEAAEWLLARDVAKWTLCHDEGFRYGTMTTNASECFNSVLKRARGLPIQALISSIYYNLVAVFNKRLDTASDLIRANDSLFAPRVKAQLQQNEREARRCSDPIRINVTEYQIFTMSSTSFKVNVQSQAVCNCTCRQPQLLHIPCPHVIAVMGQRRMNHTDFVSPFYTIQMYRQTYEAQFHVIPDRHVWLMYLAGRDTLDLIPPIVRRRTGRPRTRRYTNTMDENIQRTNRICGICKNPGHNRATCPEKRH